MAETEDIVKLGGNIELIGFKDVEPGSMVVLKKMIGGYVKKFSEAVSNFEKFSLILKNKENNELEAKLYHEGNVKESQSSGKNLFVALDEVMKKLE